VEITTRESRGVASLRSVDKARNERTSRSEASTYAETERGFVITSMEVISEIHRDGGGFKDDSVNTSKVAELIDILTSDRKAIVGLLYAVKLSNITALVRRGRRQRAVAHEKSFGLVDYSISWHIF
jgi:hypothetical protein